MSLLYRDRRGEIEARFGPETVMWLDTCIEPFRTCTRNHPGYILLLLRRHE
ncbi:hypothetical protein NORO109296_10555 [Nocardiopsis rhodophaea]